MSYKNILVEREERLFVVTINRPKAMNALDPDTNFELQDAFDEFERDPEMWICIITGAGSQAFSAGGDIRVIFQARQEGARDQNDFRTPEKGYGGLTRRRTLYKPVIAACNGLAMGGGLEVALACDIIIAADHAIFGLPEPKIGVTAMSGGMHRLPRIIGSKPAMEMLLTADPITAKRAYELGLVNEVVPGDQLMQSAKAMAERILTNSPVAIQATKQCALDGMRYTKVEDAIDAQEAGEFQLYKDSYVSEDLTEGVTAFVEKRRPSWKGR